MRRVLTGFLFASLWASASVVTKVGLSVAQPLVLSNTRFFLAGIIMLLLTFLLKKDVKPSKGEWKPLMIYGLLNVTIYLSAFVFAMQHITAGIGTLGVATCPLLISILNALWLKRVILWRIWLGLFLGMLGVGISTYPLLLNSTVTASGLSLLILSMLSYSIGTVYFQSNKWHLSLIAINGWQILFGACFLLPFTLIVLDVPANQINLTFWFCVGWLVFPVSIAAVQLWLFLLKAEPLRASLWLFLCPIFGFAYSNIFLNEPITLYTIVGTILVISGLYIGQKK
ncbi:MAG: DMT family transporter [Saprospiraceae bacterium]